MNKLLDVAYKLEEQAKKIKDEDVRKLIKETSDELFSLREEIQEDISRVNGRELNGQSKIRQSIFIGNTVYGKIKLQ